MSETEKKPTELLPVELNAEEIEINARALGEAVQKKKEVEAVLSSQKTAAKQQIEALDTEIGSRSRVAVTGKEERPVPVQYRKDFERGLVKTIRMDSFDVVATRPMTESERQQGLFERLEDEKPAPSRGKSSKQPSPEVEKLAKDIRELEKKVPGFTEKVVQPLIDAKTKKSAKPKTPAEKAGNGLARPVGMPKF